MKGKTAPRETVSAITVRLDVREAEKLEFPDLEIAAFDATGTFLAAAPVRDGAAGLKIPARLVGSTVRFLVGPRRREEPWDLPAWMSIMLSPGEEPGGSPRYGRLIRSGSFEKRVVLRPELKAVDVAVYQPDWSKWLFVPCTVKGRLVKKLKLPDGSIRELGVCNACVKIYEVDRIWDILVRLPDFEILRFRDELRDLLRKIGPLQKWPPPPPPPEGVVAFPVAPPPRRSAAAGSAQAGGESPGALSAELETVLAASGVASIRAALLDRTDLIHPLFCHFPWLHQHLHMDLISCACTDSQGRFERTVWYRAGGDHPDLYFRAMQCIDGSPHVVYDPGAWCHTFWDHPCGTEVVLEVSDPAARVCAAPDPVEPPAGVGPWVMPYGVGDIRLFSIKPTGLTDAIGYVDSPFGGRLGFRHGFSSTIPSTGIYYYRWQYRLGAGLWREFTETVVRHYVKELPGKLPTFPVVAMGPKAVGGMHLYRFKPPQPSDCDDFIPGGTNYWTTDDWFGDVWTGFLDTLLLPGGIAASAGQYTIRLEIRDQSGVLVDPASGAFSFIVPDHLDTDGLTLVARAALAGEVVGKGFEFKLHVDNRPCAASIDAPSIGLESAGDLCGFLRYAPADQVRIGFTATHPADFAVFSFSVTRAAGLATGASGETGALAAGPFTGDGDGNFAHLFPNGALRGPCSEAAFAENLSVWAKATNGQRRLDEYDRYAVRAFALAPATGV